ncbi:conserved membrane hypothetical protein [Nostocoides australiense Ben110]|uniref:LysM domain-containing protein n=1 Tax=Nostocoides australiense Ben110 TaxID=1193182 RepID=W6K2Y6_9MICO|nr:LysM peptidoglycan-binding domain-containing protein [Tetrasphaera australiensis]CCH75520.1 conserved membrane hypothetical protein [Tetrasphaera australiensis Ben110]
MAYGGRPARPSRVRTIATLAALAGVNALLTVITWHMGSVAMAAIGAAQADPQAALIAVLATAGLAVLLAAVLDITHQCQVFARARRQLAAATTMTWRTRIAAALIGVGIGSATPAAATMPAPQTVLTAPAQPGAGATAGLPSSPAVAPDPRWGAGADTASPLIRLTRTGTDTGTGLEEVVVRRGECLWDIVARRLGPSASAAQIDAEWPRWYAANRARIGADPDLIRPGLRLVVPSDVAS